MAICQIVESTKQTYEQADQVYAHVRSSGPVPPDGARLVLAGPTNPGFRMISVWDSEEARDRFFAERLGPAYEQAGLSLEDTKRTSFEVARLTAGDLTGVPQPA